MLRSQVESFPFAPDTLRAVIEMGTASADGKDPRRVHSEHFAQPNDSSHASVADPAILYVDDRPDAALARLLELGGFRIQVARTGHGALAMADAKRYDVMILDLHLPDMFGITVLGRLRAKHISTAVLVVTGCYGEEEIERLALRTGAAAFRRKPLLLDDLTLDLREIIARRAQTIDPRPSQSAHADDVFALSGCSRAADELAQWIARVGPRSTPVLITGESGVGKELAARALHRASARAGRTFVPINCGAIPDGLLESELFGHTKGAFTGAVTDKPGLFEAAHTGTLFLDEIAELPASMQVRLLRALEDGEIRRVGETRVRHVDARIIAATNRRIREEIRCGRFREDLYFRLAVANYHIPPLRERQEEIEPLARYWLKRIAVRESAPVLDICPAAIGLLRSYRWPGNIRELRNVLEHSMVWATGPVLTEDQISKALSSVECDRVESVQSSVGDPDKSLAALEAHHWNRTAAARSLGIDRTTLWRRLKRTSTARNRRND